MKLICNHVIARGLRSAYLTGTALASAAVLQAAPAWAYDFNMGNFGELGDVHASWVTQATTGFGLRTESASCSLIGTPGTGGCGANVNSAQYGNGSNGDANYKAGQFYTAYIKGTTELLLTSSEGYKFMGRGTGVWDFAAPNTSTTSLSDYAVGQSVHNGTLLDLWASKDFTIGDERAHWRLGNQVINWGESLYAAGGINATNSLDIQKLLIPGTQLKEGLLPAPMISFATGILPGLSVETYYQFMWNPDRIPPVGTYFSTSNIFDKGRASAIYLNGNNANLNSYAGDPNAIAVPLDGNDQKPGSQGEWGVNVHYKPTWLKADFGLYYMNYHDKLPVLMDLANGDAAFRYLPNRQLYGASTNFPISDWSIGSELSYRPHDAVELTGCYLAGGLSDGQNNGFGGGQCNQWKDQQRYQYDLTAQLNQSPSLYPMLDWALGGADTAYLTFEYTDIYVPGVSPDHQYTSTINGTKVYQLADANYNTWLQNSSSGVIAAGQGTAHSGGITLDYNWTYDGTVIPGWQLTPGATFTWSIYGYTPDINANYLKGAKNINYYLQFNQNPTVWQAGLNFTHYFGGTALTQPFSDRDFVGGFVTRNF